MLNHIDYIYEIYKEGSFTKAAEKLFVSQPALSLAIKKLEDETEVTKTAFEVSVGKIDIVT